MAACSAHGGGKESESVYIHKLPLQRRHANDTQVSGPRLLLHSVAASYCIYSNMHHYYKLCKGVMRICMQLLKN